MWNPKLVIGLVVICAIWSGAFVLVNQAVGIYLDAASLLFVLGPCIPLGWMAGHGDLALSLRRMADYAVAAGWAGTMIGVVASHRVFAQFDVEANMLHYAIACLPCLYGYTAKITLGFAGDVIHGDRPAPTASQ